MGEKSMCKGGGRGVEERQKWVDEKRRISVVSEIGEFKDHTVGL